ncbi:hypothetical protein [uncultured Roseibium sp.]|uniref:hypothetical protein n=1 Tax=uncultured Roseibium sp. TaxID=1936171 RepID=UPI0026224C53|nr:hypothetical protein [uncultured Roseibium sp.]
MTGSTSWTSAWHVRLCGKAIAAALLTGAVSASLPVAELRAQDNQGLRNHILGIGNCPPWNPQAREVCYNSLERVVGALSPRLDAEPEAVHLLINEGASASALKLKVTELANGLGPNDRLIIYANLPLGQLEADQGEEVNGYILEFWASEQPETPANAISEGTWISAPAFAAMIHTIPAAEVVLMLDTNNSYAVNMHLLDTHSVDHKERPEALVSSAGAGQTANYSADRTISLFAKHLALALEETDGSLQDVMTVAVGGTRQAAIPICAALNEHKEETSAPSADCQQVPQIHDPSAILNDTMLLPVIETVPTE